MRFYYRTGERSGVSVGPLGALVILALVVAAVGEIVDGSRVVLTVAVCCGAWALIRWIAAGARREPPPPPDPPVPPSS